MKTYKHPIFRVVKLNAKSSILAGSNMTYGGSNSGQYNPTAESKSCMFWEDDDE